MPRPPVAATAVIAALLSPLPAAGVNPLDNDAGSGGDAGDARALALRVGPGTWGGRLTNPLDMYDAYVFEGTFGEWVHFSLASDEALFVELYGPDDEDSIIGLPHAFTFAPHRATHLLTADGSWFFFVYARNQFDTRALHYVLTFSFSHPAQYVIAAAEPTWQTLEIALEGPTSFVINQRLAIGHQFDLEPLSLASAIAYELSWEGMGSFRDGGTAWVGATSYGGDIAIEPIGLREKLPLPGFAMPSVLGDSGYVGAWELGSWLHRAEGLLRLASAHIGGPPVVLSFSADRPFTLRTASGYDGVFLWTESNSGAEVALAVPGASIATDRAASVSGDRHIIGAFSPWLHAGWLTYPSGESQALDFFDAATFAGLPEGTWGFSLNATAGAGGLGRSPYLTTVEVPLLGLVPDWRMPPAVYV